MRLGIMSRQSASLGQPTLIRHKWFVPALIVTFVFDLTISQGELAHRLVKRLYGLTNKKDASEQISRRYRRAHHFDASEDPNSSEGAVFDESPSLRDGTGGSPELHHTITNSRNNPLQLASFSSARTQDPAARVSMHPPHRARGLTQLPEFYL